MVSALHIATARRLRARARIAVALVATFAVWTLLVWGGRIRNIVAADDLDAVGRAWRLGLAAVFVVGAVIVLGMLWAARGDVQVHRQPGGSHRVVVPSSLLRAVTALAVTTAVVWLVRGGAIVLGDYDAGFKVVHSALAVVSIALGVAAWWAVAPPRSTGRPARR